MEGHEYVEIYSTERTALCAGRTAFVLEERNVEGGWLVSSQK
jgi:hypothetical protein